MLLQGKKIAVFNVANKKSIAWAIAQSIMKFGGEVIIGYQNERLKENVEELIADLNPKPLIVECDVSKDENIEKVVKEIESNVGKIDGFVHSIAFAPSEALKKSLHTDIKRSLPYSYGGKCLFLCCHE